MRFAYFATKPNFLHITGANSHEGQDQVCMQGGSVLLNPTSKLSMMSGSFWRIGRDVWYAILWQLLWCYHMSRYTWFPLHSAKIKRLLRVHANTEGKKHIYIYMYRSWSKGTDHWSSRPHSSHRSWLGPVHTPERSSSPPHPQWTSACLLIAPVPDCRCFKLVWTRVEEWSHFVQTTKLYVRWCPHPSYKLVYNSD